MWRIIENWCPRLWWRKGAPDQEEDENKFSSGLPHAVPCGLGEQEGVHAHMSVRRRTSAAALEDVPVPGKLQYPELERMLCMNQQAATPSVGERECHVDDAAADSLLPSTPYLRSLVCEDKVVDRDWVNPPIPVEEVDCDTSGESAVTRTPDVAVEKFLVGGHHAVQIVGLANTTRRYAPARAIPVRQTPFKDRVENEVLREKAAMQVVKRRPRDSHGD